MKINGDEPSTFPKKCHAFPFNKDTRKNRDIFQLNIENHQAFFSLFAVSRLPAVLGFRLLIIVIVINSTVSQPLPGFQDKGHN